ncbi:MAG: hypothetical protein IJ221_07435 [Oscillibacter sp.]|nr:hypothetical protein [Oscillibacter sp.]
MNEQEPLTSPWEEENAPLLPEGWKEGEDLFAAEEDAAPTTGGEPSAGEERAPEGADGKRTYRLKVNHREREVALSDEEVVARLQKSYAFDEWKRPADLRSQVEEARALYPDLQEVPEEVAQAVADGSGFVSAYSAWRERETARSAAALRRENEILRHNQEVLSRAPVRGVSGGGGTNARPVSDFERGFDADAW